ncbi:flagellar basal body-associated FliL family protein [Hydrogenimonas sp.]
MKFFAFLSLLSLFLFSGEIRFDSIKTTLLSQRDNKPVNVDISIVLQGRDVDKKSEDQLMDALQTALGSMSAEKLLTAQGKQALKKRVIELADKEYGLEVDFVYIKNVRIELCTLEKIREILKGRL